MPIERITASPHWNWMIVVYFFLGGLAGGLAFISGLAVLAGGKRYASIVRWAAWLPLPLTLVCLILLVLDLGRPERFLNMLLQSNTWLPMFKIWSPMSYGSWIVFVFSLLAGINFVAALVSTYPRGLLAKFQWLPRLLDGGPLGIIFQLVYMLFGFGLASYTGALVAASNQPFWSDTPFLGGLFFASGVSTALATLVLLLARRRDEHDTVLRLESADNWAMLIEMAFLILFLLFLGRWLPSLLGHMYGWMILGGTLGLGMLVPLLLHWRPRLLGRASPVVAASLVLVGGFILRWALVYGGQDINVAGR